MTTFPTLTIEQAFEAMKVFLDAYWERGARTDDKIANLLRTTG